MWLGTPGNLTQIVTPARGIEPGLDRPAEAHQLIGGGRVVDRAAEARRTYRLSWNRLTPEQFGTLEALYLTPGPLILVDPGRRNLLPANVSMGSDALRAADDVFCESGGTVTSSTTYAYQGLRSYAWTPGTSASSRAWLTGMTANTETAEDGQAIPVLPSTDYAAQVRLRFVGSPPSAGYLLLYWYDIGGAKISNDGGLSAFTPVAGSWTNIQRSYTSPATAAWLRIHVRVNDSGADTVAYLDALQVERGSTYNSWVPGGGVPRVVFAELRPAYNPTYDLLTAQATLVEV